MTTRGHERMNSTSSTAPSTLHCDGNAMQPSQYDGRMLPCVRTTANFTRRLSRFTVVVFLVTLLKRCVCDPHHKQGKTETRKLIMRVSLTTQQTEDDFIFRNTTKMDAHVEHDRSFICCTPELFKFWNRNVQDLFQVASTLSARICK